MSSDSGSDAGDCAVTYLENWLERSTMDSGINVACGTIAGSHFMNFVVEAVHSSCDLGVWTSAVED